MNVTLAMRVKNEARWIERCVRSFLPICDRAVIMDDHSTDGTPDICAAIPNVEVLSSPFSDLDESRDKNWLLEHVGSTDWILSIDGDEMLAPGEEGKLRDEMANLHPAYSCLSFRILYLWDREDQVRVDGVYGQFRRESAFKPNGAQFSSTSAGGNFHCGNVPWQIRQKRKAADVALLHFGYMHREDRERKFYWYNDRDPMNFGEDCYRHILIGDLYPASSKFMHAGPLELKPLEEQCQVGTAA